MNFLSLQFLKDLAHLASGFHPSAHRLIRRHLEFHVFYSSVGKFGLENDRYEAELVCGSWWS
jgi:hypothetical protein